VVQACIQADECCLSFQALEKPAELLADVEEFVKKAWKPQGGKL
jgi:hypothetical protein